MSKGLCDESCVSVVNTRGISCLSVSLKCLTKPESEPKISVMSGLSMTSFSIGAGIVLRDDSARAGISKGLVFCADKNPIEKTAINVKNNFTRQK